MASANRDGMASLLHPLLLVLVVALAAGPACAARVVYDNPQGFLVPADFCAIHHVGLVENWAGTYFGPDPGFDAKVNAVRLYGMNGLEWNVTEKSPGTYDWSYWDTAFARLRHAGVKTAIYVLYNPPPFYCRHPHSYGGWKMQLPTSREATDRWLTAITTRYPEIRIIEVANEVVSEKIGAYWIGSEAELSTLADWVLDWRRATGWQGRIWSPSIPGFLGNVSAFLTWLKSYPRTAEFDAIPAHFYHVTADTFGQPASKATHWTAFVELRDGLKAAGISKPIVDGEKGFDPDSHPDAMAIKVYNYGLAALKEGIQQVCFFSWGSLGKDETNLGQPYKNPVVKHAFEDLSALAGKRIVKIVAPAPGAKWVVTFRATTPASSH